MGISFSRKASEDARLRKTARQRRQHERLVEENQGAHDVRFGQRKEFGNRRYTGRTEATPRKTRCRALNIFKLKK